MTGIRSYVSGVTLILLIASILLGGLFYLQWNQNLGGSEEPQQKGVTADPRPKQDSQSASVQLFVPLPIRSFTEITERPLFTEGRLPPEPPAEETAQAAPVPPPDLKLEGVAITSNSRTAVITDLRTNETLRLNEGMSHADWKVETVNKDSVTIKRGEQEIVLKLEIDDDSANAGRARPRIPPHGPLRRPSPALPFK
jgi:hypothetical protein